MRVPALTDPDHRRPVAHGGGGPPGTTRTAGGRDCGARVVSQATADERITGEVMADQTLANLSNEERRFEPPADLAADANVKEEAYARADSDREAFWADGRRAPRLGPDAGTRSSTGPTRPSRSGSSAGPSTRPSTASTATSTPATATRSRSTGSASRPTTPATSPTPTSSTRSRRAANALTDLGVQKGDRVAIYMPMIPEVVVAMLACARLGAPHTVVFGGFSADALASRVDRLRGQGHPHRRRWLPPRCAAAP